MSAPLTQPLCAVCCMENTKIQVMAVTQVKGTTVCARHAWDIAMVEWKEATVHSIVNGDFGRNGNGGADKPQSFTERHAPQLARPTRNRSW